MLFFNKPKPSENAKRIIEYLGCKCEYFPPAESDDALMKAYRTAFEKGKKNGFTPVIIVVDDTLTEWLTEINSEGKTPKQFREEVLSLPERDAAELFASLYESLVEDEEEGQDIGDISGGEPMTAFSGYRSYNDGSVTEAVLAYIPTSEPYEVFAWVPFGGWNECPDAPDMMTAARHWYQKYGAVPTVIGHDTLEFAAQAMSDEDALCVAKEQYALCPDIVWQGIGSVGALADSLKRSTVWFFWWD